jgi:hypothetical protein
MTESTLTPAGPMPAPATIAVPVSPGRRAAAWLRAHPGLIVLMVVPIVVFTVPLFASRAFLDGDNFIQNFPMRVLVGRDLQHGLLPYWNPYLFSGTPLLGGFNAGAAYPATWLTAVLPIFTAWTVGIIVAYEVTIVGMFAFLRRVGIGSSAATMATAVYAGAGYMTGQLVHIDLIEGASWLPWMLLAVHGLTEHGPRPGPGESTPVTAAVGEGGRRRHRGRWAALLALSLGLSILAGGAEDLIDSGVLVGIFWVGRLVVGGYFGRGHLRSLVRSVVPVAVGVAGGVLVGAGQWIPGIAFAAHSQRAQASFTFFTSGSLNIRVVTLLVSPFVLGTNQTRPVYYAGTYNFPEVTSYMGILALIATCSLFLRRWRSRPEARNWWVWYVIGVVGLLSALGGQTPFAHLMYLVPGINAERLLNRNLLLVDCAMAVLLGWWLHLLFEDRKVAASGYTPVRRRWRPGRRAELVVTCAPLTLIVVLALFLWIGGSTLEHGLGFNALTSADLHWLSGLVTVGAVIAGAATWVVLVEGRLSRTTLRRLLVAVLAVDLIFFDFFVIRPPIPQTVAQAQTPMAAKFASLVGNGRFIIYDPDEFQMGELEALGQTDLNIYTRVPSAQGYTALTDGNYYNLTGSHLQEDLGPATLNGPVWDLLNATTMLSLPSYFVTPVASPDGTRGPPSSGQPSSVYFPPDPLQDNSAPPGTPTTTELRSGWSHTWYLGTALTVDQMDIPVATGRSDQLRVGLVTSSGSVAWLPSDQLSTVGSGADRSVRVTLPGPVPSGGMVVQNQGSATTQVGVPTVHTAEAGEVALNGRLQYAVNPSHWVFTGTLGSFGVFHNSRARGWAWLDSPGGGPAPAGSSVGATAPGLGGGQTISVHATAAATLQRSESWTTGWHATIRTVGPAGTGPARPIDVNQDGAIQTVAIPGAGNYSVTFSYDPKSARVGLVLSVVGVAGLLLWLVWEVVATRRRRRQPEPSPTEPVTG